jgi:phytol kinase
VAYGRYRFATPDGMKSLEGSFAFFLCSFTCVHVPVLLMTDCGRAETLLIALLLAWLTTMLEAIAWGGLDNLILPIVAYLMLQVYWHQTAPALLARLGVTGGVTVFAAVLYRFTPLRGSAVLGASLIGYVFWTLGGWHWLVSPLILFTTSAVLTIHYPAAKDKTLNVYAVLSVTSAGLLWLCLTQVQDGADWCYPSTVSFAAHTGMVILGRLRYAHPAAPRSIIVGLSGLAGGVLILVPYVLFNALAVAAILGVLLGLLLCGLAVVVFDQIQPGIDDTPFDTPRWVRQAVVAGVVSLLAAGVGAINAP